MAPQSRLFGALGRRNAGFSEAAPAQFASRQTAESPGIVCADIEIPRSPSTDAQARKSFWIPDLPWIMKRYWDQQNWANKPVYTQRGRQSGLHAARHNSLTFTQQDNRDD